MFSVNERGIFMAQRMTWEEMKKAYPDEWVAVVNYTTNEIGEVDGEVVIHSGDKSDFYDNVGKMINKFNGMAVRYTGELIKNAEIPLLWQITHTA